MTVLHINGVPVRVFLVGNRCEAVIGVYGLVRIHGQNTDEVMGQVVALLGSNHSADVAA